MKKWSLQLRLTLIVGLITILVSILLTVNSLYSAQNYYGDYAQLIASGLVETDLPAYGEEFIYEFDPLHSYETATQQFSNQSVMVMLSIIAVALAATYWATGRVMKPLNKLTQSVQSVNGQSLNQRIPLDKAQGEVLILSESYNRMLERLEEAFLVQKSFAANAAHELKTPLAVIKSSLQVLEMTPSPQLKDYQEFMSDTNQSLARIIKTVDELLALANLSAEAMTERVDVRSLIEQSVQELAPLAQNLKLSVKIEAAAPAYIIGNAELFYRAVYNLIENAIKYNREKGTITISMQQADDLVVIKVTDTGIGMKKEALEHIFEPFYREDLSRSQRIPGSGLGLAIVKMIVEHHHGEIEVSSKLDIGTCFTLSFTANHQEDTRC